MKMVLAGFFVTVLSAPAAAVEPIVVTGQRAMPTDQVKKQAAQYVRTAVAIEAFDQYSRRTSYCPRVIGLSDVRANEVVINRVHQVGDAAGLPRPTEKCVPDLAIVFTSDADRLMRSIKARNSFLFRGQTMRKHEQLFESQRAVRWWYNLSLTDAQADRAETAMIGDAQGQISGPALPVLTSSLIATNINLVIRGNVVVIDVDKANGFSLDSIASYAAMVSLAQVNGDADFGDAPSILSIFKQRDRLMARKELSAWDRAYLRTLYTIPLNRPAWTRRGELRAALVKATLEPAD